ncbi:nucleoporin complex subunit 54-domain-containing protein [Spinellus fusiger]|nr:nucleoporin complex subunit 54-domain-containing protein [Spinellus fusiger]
MTFTFGSSATSTAAFGHAPTVAPTATPSASTFSFGTAPTPASTSNTFSFGTAPTSTPSATNTFTFGATPAATTNTPTSSVFTFGATPAASSASAASTAPASTNIAPSTFSFGAATTNTAPSTFSFGTVPKPTTHAFGLSNTAGVFGSNTQTNKEQQIWQLLVQAENDSRQKQSDTLLSIEGMYKPENIWQTLALLKAWWDPHSPLCRFKYYFYNKVPSQEVYLYQRPAHHDSRAWASAQKANPDPTCLVPALAVGFEDVKKRMEGQDKQNQAHQQKLTEMDEKIKKIKQKSLVETATKLNDFKKRHMEMTHRVIKLLKLAQVLRHKGLSITPNEDAMRAHFEQIQSELENSEQFHGKLSQLWAQLQLIKESGRQYGKVDGVHAWNNAEQDMQAMTKCLGEQHHGIEHTVQTLQKDIADMDAWEKRRL